MDWKDALFGRDDWYQQRRIGELRQQMQDLRGGVAAQSGVASSAASAIHRLTELHQEQEDEIERLEIALDTLTRVLIEKHGIDGNELGQRFREALAEREQKVRAAAEADGIVACVKCGTRVSFRDTRTTMFGEVCGACARA